MSGAGCAARRSEERVIFEDFANLVITDRRRTVARKSAWAAVSGRLAMTLLGHRTRSMFDSNNVVGHVA